MTNNSDHPRDNGDHQEESPAQGRMRFQDPETATPREPTLAEQRARQRAEQRKAEQEAEQRARAERRTQTRRRVMVGSGATVGVVALVAAFYSGTAYANRDAQVATCTAQHPQTGETIAQPDEYCDEEYREEHGTYHAPSGLFLLPMFLGGGPSNTRVGQYRYSYSPKSSPIPPVGQSVSRPNFTKPPAGTEVKTKSGSTIQRGGFGIGNKAGGSGS